MDGLDHETCYQAVTRRDARFDGRFYTAVTTTGIFCRPSCPARTPKASNVRFYPLAATASEAGFRPCRRCRPELAPGHAAWNRRTDLTGQALKAIEAGTVDRIGVAGLAAQLGVSERHLRRELNETVGTGPLQLARARRIWLARLLLDQTNLSVTDIAFAAGFGSLRQFNDSIRHTFDAPPSALRSRVRPLDRPNTVALQLPSRGPWRGDSLLGFLSMRAIPGLESQAEGCFRRNVPGGWVELSQSPGGADGLTLRCSLERLSDLAELVPIVRRVADLDTDLEAIEAHLGRDEILAGRLDSTDLARLPGTFDRFELAVRAVVGQQVSVAAARTLLGRLVALASSDEPSSGDEARALDGIDPAPVERFPSAETLARCSLDRLGMPASRRQTIQALARAVVDGQVMLAAHANPDQTRQRLLAVPGIGPWTAGYITMRALSDPDGWPAGDLVLRKSLGTTAAELERRAKRWQPFRAYAALLLWRTSTPTTTPTRGES